MTVYFRDEKIKIVTVECRVKKQPVGWKVYINGGKYPLKSHPDDCFHETEEKAIELALKMYRTLLGLETEEKANELVSETYRALLGL